MKLTKLAGLTALLPVSLTRSRDAGSSGGHDAISWATWIQSALRLPLRTKPIEVRERIELLDRMSLGGKKALLLVAIDGRRLLVGVGEEGAPSISSLDAGACVPRTSRNFSNGQPARRMRRGRSLRSVQ